MGMSGLGSRQTGEHTQMYRQSDGEPAEGDETPVQEGHEASHAYGSPMVVMVDEATGNNMHVCRGA